MFWIQNFRRINAKITMLGKSEYLFVVLWHGRSCQEMCGTMLWVSKQDDSTTLQSINYMLWWPSRQRRGNEIRGRSVKSMFSNCSEMIKLVLEDPIFYGQWTNLHDQSLNRPKHATNDYLVWSPTFVTQVNPDNIVMWETLQNSADWNCFKTPILQEILRTRNLLQVEHCVFSEAARSFQSAGCVRNKLQFRTAQQNQKSFLLDAGLRMDGKPALDLWDLIVTFLHGSTNQRKQVQATRKKILGKIDDLNDVDFVSY